MKIALYIVIGLVGLYALIGLVIYFFQEAILFHEYKVGQNHQYDFEFKSEERNYQMKDGSMINANFIPTENSKGVIFYHHGNSGNLSRWGKISQYFSQFEYDVLVYDYRGFGKSSGKRSMSNMFSDANEIYEILVKEYKKENIIVYGRSIGTGIATQLASVTNPKMLILETPFYNVNDTWFFRFLILPVDIVLSYPFPNHIYIKSVESPIFIFHGTNDEIVPYSSADKLYRSIENSHKVKFFSIEGGFHKDLAENKDFKYHLGQILSQ